MLLSDRDILAAQADGHISLEPWTPEMVQPASIDVRLDRFFRLFNNHAYTYVDPAENQGALTEQFEVASDEPWILHPGEFALGSTWEYVKLDNTYGGMNRLINMPSRNTGTDHSLSRHHGGSCDLAGFLHGCNLFRIFQRNH